MRFTPSTKLSLLVALAVLACAGPAFGATGHASLASMPLAEGAAHLPVWVFKVFDYLVLSLLALASIAGIALAIDAMLHIRESKVAPAETTEHLRSLIAGKEYKELMDFTATDNSFVSKALYAAIRRTHLKYPAMREGMESSVSEQTADLFRRIEPMNVIGNIGPLLGLLGTVLGMIMAFYQLMDSGGQAKPGDLAGGIGTALWHTFFGLFVAIPCLVVYGFYRTRADKIATKAAIVAEELLESLRPESHEDREKDRDRDASKKKSRRDSNPTPQPEQEQPA
jgi:biopolymer transport protein ExbB